MVERWQRWSRGERLRPYRDHRGILLLARFYPDAKYRRHCPRLTTLRDFRERVRRPLSIVHAEHIAEKLDNGEF